MPIPLFILAGLAGVKVAAIAAGAAAAAAGPVIVQAAGVITSIVTVTKLLFPLMFKDEVTGKERPATRCEERHHIAGLYATKRQAQESKHAPKMSEQEKQRIYQEAYKLAQQQLQAEEDNVRMLKEAEANELIENQRRQKREAERQAAYRNEAEADDQVRMIMEKQRAGAAERKATDATRTRKEIEEAARKRAAISDARAREAQEKADAQVQKAMQYQRDYAINVKDVADAQVLKIMMQQRAEGARRVAAAEAQVQKLNQQQIERVQAEAKQNKIYLEAQAKLAAQAGMYKGIKCSPCAFIQEKGNTDECEMCTKPLMFDDVQVQVKSKWCNACGFCDKTGADSCKICNKLF